MKKSRAPQARAKKWGFSAGHGGGASPPFCQTPHETPSEYALEKTFYKNLSGCGYIKESIYKVNMPKSEAFLCKRGCSISNCVLELRFLSTANLGTMTVI